ncbi:MAG: hypothetical protein LBF77_02540 [Spirochaetaceae bacterium]|jgi:hypothetical protein|nr:hypothetical protein [Spirochaetaceae bacterium]
MPELMIFKAGKYPQGDWPKERVQKMVDAYDPVKSWEAPAVIGHRYYANSDEAQFAHGWVASLRMDGSGKVFADIPEFSAEAKKAMAENKLRYMSAEIYEFDKVDETQPPYLRAVALLGRDNPQIPTARLPSLFGFFHEGTVTTIDEKEHIAAFTRKVNAEDVQTLSGQGETKTQEDSDMGKTAEELQAAELQAKLEKAEADLAAFRKENTDLKNAGKKQDAEAYFGKLRDEGKLPPALFDKAVGLDIRLAEADQKEFRTLFSELETKVDLSGTHAAGKKNAPAAASGADIAAKVRAYQAEHKLETYAEAAKALYAEKPELFEEGGEA